MKTIVSVLMPIYNQAEFLKEAIKSVINQSFKDFELLILNDGSNDNSLKIIKSFKDKRIKIFSCKKRQGLAKSLNFLIKKSKGRYLARMDGDDISKKNRLREQISFLKKNKNVYLVGTWAKLIDDKDREIAVIKKPSDFAQIKEKILNNNPFLHSSLLIRKSIVEDIGGYNEDLFYSQDYDFVLRVAVKYQCANLPRFLVRLRWLPNFKKQREQHCAAVKIRLNAIWKYGYPKIKIYKIFLPALILLVPEFIKKAYWSKRFNG